MIESKQLTKLEADWYLTPAYEVHKIIFAIKAVKKSIIELNKSRFEITKQGKNGNKDEYEIYLPESIWKSIDRIVVDAETMNNKYPGKKLGEYALESAFGRDENGELDIPEQPILTVQVDVGKGFFNRMHVSGEGLQKSMRRLKIGSKVYERMAEKYGYVTSNNMDSSTDAQLLWLSLASNSNLYVFIGKYRMIVFSKKWNAGKVISVLEDAFQNNQNSLMMDKEFVKNNRVLMKKSLLGGFL